jgi:hypothetical protein
MEFVKLYEAIMSRLEARMIYADVYYATYNDHIIDIYGKSFFYSEKTLISALISLIQPHMTLTKDDSEEILTLAQRAKLYTQMLIDTNIIEIKMIKNV